MIIRHPGSNDDISIAGRSLGSNNSELMRRVAARLDLPISMNVVQQGFKLNVIKRCWEDQLHIKRKLIYRARGKSTG